MIRPGPVSGRCGIRTHGDPEATTAFEAAPFVRSGNLPGLQATSETRWLRPGDRTQTTTVRGLAPVVSPGAYAAQAWARRRTVSSRTGGSAEYGNRR
jgi:hypothetical protein